MKKLTIFFALLIIFSCKTDKRGARLKTIDLNDGKLQAFFVDDTTMHGEAKFFSKGGILESKVRYRNGRKDGIAINYYPNGNVWDSSFYTGGKMHGLHYVFDSLNHLIYMDNYYHGHRLGGQVFYRNGKLYKYVFSNFEKNQLYEGLYDSSESLYRYGGEIINASLYYAEKDNMPFVGVFSYFLNPPNVSIKYSMGLTRDKTDVKRELVIFDSKTFIDTIVEKPLSGWNYYIAARYDDTLNRYNKVFITVLK